MPERPGKFISKESSSLKEDLLLNYISPRPNSHVRNQINSPLPLHSVEAMMQGGKEKFDQKVSALISQATGDSLVGLEIRFQNVSLTAKVSVDDNGHADIPTVYNSMKHAIQGIFRSQKQESRTILNNVSGVFQPGTMTLILGQPGSGKSALMKVLSGRFPLEKSIELNGTVQLNGIPSEELKPILPRLVSYVNQYDEHIPTLSVLETFKFAHQCTSGHQVPEWVEKTLMRGDRQSITDKALSTIEAIHSFQPELVVRNLGLESCQDTVVGNAMLRGVSGGEKKRVTTGEMMQGISFAMLLDEISTGLDSATTYDIIKSLQSVAKQFNKAIVISLLQPPPEVFDLFDNVLLLGKGNILYHGPRQQVLPFFASLGYYCPPRKDPADFLLDIGTTKGLNNSQAKNVLSCEEIAEKFQRTEISRHMENALDTPVSSEIIEKYRDFVELQSPFQQSFWESTITVLKRQMTIAWRNKAFINGRVFMIFLMGFLNGTAYWDSNTDNAQLVIGFIFAAVLFMSLGQFAQMPTFMEYRAIFYKQRRANFFRSSTYVLSNAISFIPFSIVETIVFGSLVYWMTGLARAAEQFIVFEVVLFLTNISLTFYFFFISTISPDIHIAQPLGSVSILLFVVFAGFIVTKDTIPDYLIWIYWMNPVSWSIRALAVNEYKYDDFQVCDFNGFSYCDRYGKTFGDYSLSSFAIPYEKMWIINGVIYLLAIYVVCIILSILALENIRYESSESASIADKDLREENEEIELARRLSSKASQQIQIDIGLKSSRHFTPVTLAFTDLWYSVPSSDSPKEEIDLLKGVSGFAAPGTMTALMGSSGAGKTTLMDVIAGRKTEGRIQGKILLNGYPATDLAIRRCTGYCEQMDIHSGAATVYEALKFSAFLRQSSEVTAEQKLETVEECLDLLELRDLSDKIVRSLSNEQKKRLTIGVELAAQPSIIFLDEPTSGLDARAAKVIMDGVRKIADSGRTIVCTIHQPSSEVFRLFDSLLLLKRGGECVYFGELGEESSNLIDYFTRIPGTIPIESGYNPATWMLEVIGAGTHNIAEDDGASAANHLVQTNYSQWFQDSPLYEQLKNELNQPGRTRPSQTGVEIQFQNKRASDGSIQFQLLIRRFMLMYWRTPTYNLTRFVLLTILAIIFGIIYYDTDYTTFTGINSGVGMVFLNTIFIGIIGFNSVIPMVSEERPVFYRERSSETYNALWYFASFGLIEIPYVFGSVFLYSVIFYPMVGFTGYLNFFWYWLNLSLYVLLQVYLGEFLAIVMPNMEVAAVMGTLLNSIFVLFSGFNPPESQIPSAYKWLYHISIPKYSVSVLTSSVFSVCDSADDLGCSMVQNAPPIFGNVSVKDYVETNFNMKDDEQVMNFLVNIAFIVVFRLLALISLRYVNHQKR